MKGRREEVEKKNEGLVIDEESFFKNNTLCWIYSSLFFFYSSPRGRTEEGSGGNFGFVVRCVGGGVGSVLVRIRHVGGLSLIG